MRSKASSFPAFSLFNLFRFAAAKRKTPKGFRRRLLWIHGVNIFFALQLVALISWSKMCYRDILSPSLKTDRGNWQVGEVGYLRCMLLSWHFGPTWILYVIFLKIFFLHISMRLVMNQRTRWISAVTLITSFPSSSGEAMSRAADPCPKNDLLSDPEIHLACLPSIPSG